MDCFSAGQRLRNFMKTNIFVRIPFRTYRLNDTRNIREIEFNLGRRSWPALFEREKNIGWTFKGFESWHFFYTEFGQFISKACKKNHSSISFWVKGFYLCTCSVLRWQMLISSSGHVFQSLIGMDCIWLTGHRHLNGRRPEILLLFIYCMLNSFIPRLGDICNINISFTDWLTSLCSFINCCRKNVGALGRIGSIYIHVCCKIYVCY